MFEQKVKVDWLAGGFDSINHVLTSLLEGFIKTGNLK